MERLILHAGVNDEDGPGELPKQGPMICRTATFFRPTGRLESVPAESSGDHHRRLFECPPCKASELACLLDTRGQASASTRPRER